MSAGAGDDSDVVAAAWMGRPGCISLAQAKVLLTAAQWASLSARDLATVVVTVTGAERMDEITPEGFAEVMDRFVVDGFRHPAVPMVTAAQLAALDEARRFLGLDGRLFVGLVRHLGGVRSRRQLDGTGFLAVWGWLARHGADIPVPGHGFMTRPMVRLVHEAAYHQRMDAAALCAYLAPIGGVLRAGQLDRRGFMRLLIAFDGLGVPVPQPVPAVPGDLGMVTQAQANLLWRLWLDFDGWKGDVSPVALDAAIGSIFGMDGGLASLTRAGARAVIDRFMAPRMSDRRAAEPADDPPCRPVHNGRERTRRERRRVKGGRR